MDGNEFLKRLKRLARRNGVEVRIENHGKGSHQRLYYGERRTTMQDRRKELKKGMVAGMCADLGVTLNDLMEK